MARIGRIGEESVSVSKGHFKWLASLALLFVIGCGSQGEGSAVLEAAPKPNRQAEENIQEQINPSDSFQGAPHSSFNLSPRGLFVALPALPGGSRARHQMTRSGAGLLISGGIAGDQVFSKLLIFNSARGAFETLPIKLREARFGHTATAVPGPDNVLGTRDDGVLIVGGYNGKFAVASVELIHPDPNGDGVYSDARHESLTKLPFGLADHGAVLASRPDSQTNASAVLITGGMAFTKDSAEQDHKASVELSQDGVPAVTNASIFYKITYNSLNQARGEIDGISQPQFARRGHAVTLLPGLDKKIGTFDDQILVTGGLGYDISQVATGISSQIMDSPEIYEPSLNRWTTVTLLGEADLKPGRSAHRALATNFGVLLVGGISESGPQRTSVWLDIDPADPSLAELRFAGKLKQAREHPEIAYLGNMIFVVGGFNEELDTALDTVETFNPADKIPLFEKHESILGAPRVFHAMVEFDNRLIITGGYTQPGLLTEPDAEFYNPVNTVK